MADLYGCDWYPILKRIAELAYNITLPSDEIQQARMVQRQAKYEEKLSVTRATLAKQEKKKVDVLPEVPREPSVSLDVYLLTSPSLLVMAHIFLRLCRHSKIGCKDEKFRGER